MIKFQETLKRVVAFGGAAVMIGGAGDRLRTGEHHFLRRVQCCSRWFRYGDGKRHHQ